MPQQACTCLCNPKRNSWQQISARARTLHCSIPHVSKVLVTLLKYMLDSVETRYWNLACDSAVKVAIWWTCMLRLQQWKWPFGEPACWSYSKVVVSLQPALQKTKSLCGLANAVSINLLHSTRFSAYLSSNAMCELCSIVNQSASYVKAWKHEVTASWQTEVSASRVFCLTASCSLMLPCLDILSVIGICLFLCVLNLGSAEQHIKALRFVEISERHHQ